MKSVFVTAIVLASVVTVSGAAVAFVGGQDSSSPSTIQYSTVKTEKSTPETKNIEKVSAPVAVAPVADVAAPATVAPVASTPAPVAPAPVTSVPVAPEAYVAPTTCPDGSQPIQAPDNGMPAQCSVIVPASSFTE